MIFGKRRTATLRARSRQYKVSADEVFGDIHDSQ
jgi:dTDP-D-glucose 4,6-dehydratase